MTAELKSLARTIRPAIIAIDGPAASGKSTAGFRLAQLLDYLFLDTGVMYRAVTLSALAAGLRIEDEPAVSELAATVHLDIRAPAAGERDGRHCTVLADGADITWAIRTPEVDRNVSAVSSYAGVRAALTEQQRRIAERYGRGDAEKPGIVMVGRDMGTVVVPDAYLKLYIDASPEERARRRYNELRKQGKPLPYAEVLQDIYHRDQYDSGRNLAPLRAAADAIVIDNSTLTSDQTLGLVVQALQTRAASGLRP
ncbi:MAG: (d)CMP kinase [Caldilineaceae bacterium]|nr:(d)CMP kinase [Caldilineaceae bacterium]